MVLFMIDRVSKYKQQQAIQSESALFRERLRSNRRLKFNVAPPLRFRLPLMLLACLSLSGITACGDDEENQVQRGLTPEQLKRIQSSGGQSSSDSKAQGSVSQKIDLSNLVTIPNRLKRAELLKSTGWDSFKRIRERIQQARDPFWPDIPELKNQDEVEVDPSSVQRKLVVTVPESIENLKFKGTLTGMASNLAMLEDGGGTGYSVRVGDIIGKAPEYVRVKMITSNKISFEPVLGIDENEPEESPRLVKFLREESDQSEIELGANR